MGLRWMQRGLARYNSEAWKAPMLSARLRGTPSRSDPVERATGMLLALRCCCMSKLMAGARAMLEVCCLFLLTESFWDFSMQALVLLKENLDS